MRFIHKICLFIILILGINTLKAQSNLPKTNKTKQGKYPSVFWEITGNGLRKPSYLYGTMHVSEKVAFNLKDSFFIAIKNVDVVGLEKDPSVWMEDFYGEKYSIFYGLNRRGFDYYRYNSNIYNDAYKFKIPNKDKIKTELRKKSRIANFMLYRGSNSKADFEENTFLDMFVFQVGKKWGKQTVSLESNGEVEIAQAKSNIPDDKDEDADDEEEVDDTPDPQGRSVNQIIQDSYREGDLDLLDSMMIKTSQSKNHLTYFLYERNANMVRRIDSIVKGGQTIFAAIGAAHLPGKEGAIEMLRRMGYTLKPILSKVGALAKQQKNELEELFIPQKFYTQYSEDSFFSVNVPGKLFVTKNSADYKEYTCTDVVNGAYFTISRMRTGGIFTGQSPELNRQVWDSLLFENVPGKILDKKFNSIGGYPTIDIVNRTKKRDYQCYKIVFTPFETIMFRLSGTLNYAKGKITQDFLKSIKILNKGDSRQYFSKRGGFKITMPGKAQVYGMSKNGLFKENVAINYSNANESFFLYKTLNPKQYYMEEDTFIVSRLLEGLPIAFELDEGKFRYEKVKEYPAGVSNFKAKDSSDVYLKSIVKGNVWYMLGSNSKSENKRATFFNSFDVVKDMKSNDYHTVVDSNWNISYPSTSQHDTGEIGVVLNKMESIYRDYKNKKKALNSRRKSIQIKNKGADEEVGLYMYKFHAYAEYKNPMEFINEQLNWITNDSSMVLQNVKYNKKPKDVYLYAEVRDTNSQRITYYKKYLRNRIRYTLVAYGDEKNGMTPHSQYVFDNVKIFDGDNSGMSMFDRRAPIFIADLTSGDSARKKDALKNIDQVVFKNEDLDKVENLLDTFHFGKKKHIDRKVNLITGLSKIKTNTNLELHKRLYNKTNDTVTYQVRILKNLIRLKTKKSYRAAIEIMDYETPLGSGNSYSNKVSKLIGEFEDSLELCPVLFPEILGLLEYKEYKEDVIELISRLMDSNLIKPKLYKQNKNSFIKKARASSKRMVSKENEQKENYSRYSYNRSSNKKRSIHAEYAYIVAPYAGKDKRVDTYFEKMLQSKNINNRIHAVVALLKNNKSIPDTSIRYIANNRKGLCILYSKLQKINKLNLLNDSFINNDKLVASSVYVDENLGKKDTITFVEKFMVNSKKGEQWVYIYKLKKKRLKNLKFVYSYGAKADANEFSYKTIRSFVLQNFKEFKGKKYKKIKRNIRKKYAFIHKDNYNVRLEKKVRRGYW